MYGLNLIGKLMGMNQNDKVSIVDYIEGNGKLVIESLPIFSFILNNDFQNNYCNRTIEKIDYKDNEEIYYIYLSNEDITSRYDKFEKELTELINKNCLENYSDTPDYVLSRFLVNSLQSFENTIKLRDLWYDFKPWESEKSNVLIDQKMQEEIDEMLEEDNENENLYTLEIKVTDSNKFESIIKLVEELCKNEKIDEVTRSEFRANFYKILKDDNDDSKSNE